MNLWKGITMDSYRASRNKEQADSIGRRILAWSKERKGPLPLIYIESLNIRIAYIVMIQFMN